MSIFAQGCREISRRTQKNTFALFCLNMGWAVGALTNKFTDYTLVAFSILTAIFLFKFGLDYYRSQKIVGFTSFELTLRDPTESALRACERANEDYLVVGDSIELQTHPQLNSRADLTKLGWPPEEVRLADRQIPFDASIALERCHGVKSFDPPNGDKYSLVQNSFTVSDRPTLELTVAKTKYFVVRSVLEHLKSNLQLRAQLAKLEPEKNQIPHSLCLHFIVRFADGHILCIHRDKRAAYHGHRWSFSGEEQVSEADFQHETPCLALFQRTVCEEVFPLREDLPLAERWSIAGRFVESMALWSLFIEENIQNFSLLGFIQLNCEPKHFVAEHRRVVSSGLGSRDKEGGYYLVHTDHLMQLLVNGKTSASALFSSDTKRDVLSQDLHPTSRYRLFRYLRGANRGPIVDASPVPA